MPAAKLIPVAIDEGAGRVKLSFRNSKGEIETHITPSTMIRGTQSDTDDYLPGVFRLPKGIVVSVTDETNEPISNHSPEIYQVSEENLAVFQNALISAGFGGKNVAVAASLPILMYFTPGLMSAINTGLIKDKQENLKRAVEVMRQGLNISKVKKVMISPEAIGAAHVLINGSREAGKKAYGEHDHLIGIDIGESTTDVVEFDNNGLLISAPFSIEIGVGAVRSKLIEKLAAKGIQAKFRMAENILRNKTFRAEDYTDTVNEAVAEVYEDLRRGLRQVLTAADASTTVFLFGGGAFVFKDHLRIPAGKLVIPRDPDTVLSESMLLSLEKALAVTENKEPA